MPDLSCSAHLSFPEITPEELIKLLKDRPFHKFVSFPINITIAEKVYREEIDLEDILDDHSNSE